MAVVVTGHYGGVERDLRLVAGVFTQHSPMRAWVGADHEAIKHPKYRGDHAGATETSQLWYLRPDLVDISRLTQHDVETRYFAAGPNAFEASRRLGEEIVRGQIEWLGAKARELLDAYAGSAQPPVLSFDETEAIWREVEGRREEWITLKLRDGQQSTPDGSPWKSNERVGWVGES